MNGPPEVAEIVLEILRIGLLRIRAAGWRGDAHRCAVEADHLHNLPSLLTHFSPEVLRFYWDTERPLFLNESDGDALTQFAESWNRLARFVVREPLAEGLR
jgi:hypothetical protein